ncbi:hypothetical protein KC19_VG320200 [Ceratodon purpureus]|uniref:Secreted protein n=1 Tax=Ceratodon purpureus TaxID=3225 RepID=A0A8T0HWG3_CERPU|nr:hypothetical protein KC19_VG320200 [Ceratodon purpureus]
MGQCAQGHLVASLVGRWLAVLRSCCFSLRSSRARRIRYHACILDCGHSVLATKPLGGPSQHPWDCPKALVPAPR